jgi:hypothetical protein
MCSEAFRKGQSNQATGDRLDGCTSWSARLYGDCMRTVCGLYEDCVWTVWGLCVDCMRTVCGLYGDCMRTVWGLCGDCMRTVRGLSPPFSELSTGSEQSTKWHSTARVNSFQLSLGVQQWERDLQSSSHSNSTDHRPQWGFYYAAASITRLRTWHRSHRSCRGFHFNTTQNNVSSPLLLLF